MSEPAAIIFDNPLEWAPASAFAGAPEDGKWHVQRGVWGARGGTLVVSGVERQTPELIVDPKLSGWHEVRLRIYHRRGGETYGSGFGLTVYAGTTSDRSLRGLRAQLATEAFEVLSLGPRDMTGARLRIDGAYANCCLDSVEFVPCTAPTLLPTGDRELAGILDFADAPDDYRPATACAAEAVRVHAEAGFDTIFWKAYAVRCEFPTRVGLTRSAAIQPHLRVNVGHLLEQYDTLATAVTEAHANSLKILGWMRINNEFSRRVDSDSPEWLKFSQLPPFHEQHPEMRKRDRDGNLLPQLSFAYPEVRQYLCDIAREILDRGADGLMIDVLRHPPMVCFDEPLVHAFMAETRQDPRRMPGDGTEAWLRFRATAFTELLRDLRRMMQDHGYADKELAVRAMPQPWRLLRDGCDLRAWMDAGLIDCFIAGHHCITGPGHPVALDLAPVQELLAGRARLLAQVLRSSDWHTAPALARQAYAQGADGVVVYESNHAVTLPDYRDRLHLLKHADPSRLEILP